MAKKKVPQKKTARQVRKKAQPTKPTKKKAPIKKRKPMPRKDRGGTHAKAKPGDKRLGNRFWEIRSKHGRDVLFATPELMWQAAVEYFYWCEDNPLIEVEMKSVPIGNNMGSDIVRVETPKMRVFTLHGLCSYLHCNTLYFNDFKKSLTAKDEKGFSIVIRQIEETIYNQKFTGASAGFLNANIIARDLALVDHNKQDGELVQYQVPISKEELDAARKLNNDRI
jgi:hypothetical protein